MRHIQKNITFYIGISLFLLKFSQFVRNTLLTIDVYSFKQRYVYAGSFHFDHVLLVFCLF